MEKEKKIVIATHGELAKGLVSALSIIVGNTSEIEIICGYLNAEFNLTYEIEILMNKTDFAVTELIVCTDMMGGSVNNEFMKYLTLYPFHLVTNINLAFLVDLVLTPTITTDSLNNKVNDELVAVKYINRLIEQYDEEIDDSL